MVSRMRELPGGVIAMTAIVGVQCTATDPKGCPEEVRFGYRIYLLLRLCLLPLFGHARLIAVPHCLLL